MLKKYGVFVLLGVLLLTAIVLKRFGGKLPSFEQEPGISENEAALPETTVEPMQQDYFMAFREERENVRKQEMQYLDEIIATTNVDAQTLEQAVEQKLCLVENMEAEFTIESMITAKGFSDAAVTFHNGSVNVVVGTQELTEAEVAQILDIVHRETGENAENIKVTTGGTNQSGY